MRQGEWIAKAPYGYKNVKTATGHSNLVVDDFAATIVKQLFELYATRLYSVQTLTAKVKTDYGLDWDPSFTAKILQRHFYYGHMEVNKQLYPHKYPPLISKELFDQVKALKDNFNKKKQQYKTTGIEFLYRGLLRCAQCDLTITPERQKGFAYYHCTEYYGKHGAKWLREEKITEAIEQVFKQLQMPEDIAEQITAMLNEQYEHQAKFHSQHLVRIEQEQKTLQRMKENLYVDRLKGRITEHEYDNFFKKLEEEQVNINHRLQKLQDADANYYVTSAQIISLTSQAHDLFKSSEVNEKRHLIKFLLQNLQISGENVLYELKKPFDLLLNCSEEVRWRP